MTYFERREEKDERRMSIAIAPLNRLQSAGGRKVATHSNHVLGGLELPEGDIDGDTTLTLGLQLVEHPGYRTQKYMIRDGRSDQTRQRRTHHT